MFQWNDYKPADPESTVWDVVIIGAGMGGSVLGWSLARQNFRSCISNAATPSVPLGRSKERPEAAKELAASTLSARESSRRRSSTR